MLASISVSGKGEDRRDESGKTFEGHVLDHFGVSSTHELVDAVYSASASAPSGSLNDLEVGRVDLGSDPKERLASVAPLVLGLAFPSAGDPYPEAVQVVSSAIDSLVILVSNLANLSSLPSSHEVSRGSAKPKVACTGGLMRHNGFRMAFSNKLVEGGYIEKVEELRFIEEPVKEVGLLMPLMFKR